MNWMESHRFDRRALPIADRHYNRQKPGTPQFVPPGRCVVLLTRAVDALWVTSWPSGAWVCSCFRKEGPGIASEMIREAVAATRSEWPVHPVIETPAGPVVMVTFIDPEKVQPIMRRGKPHWGYTWERAGFERDGKTEGGLLAFVMRPEGLPEAKKPWSQQRDLEFVA